MQEQRHTSLDSERSSLELAETRVEAALSAGPYAPALFRLALNSVSGLISKMWYRIPFDQSEQSKAKIPPTASPETRPGRDP